MTPTIRPDDSFAPLMDHARVLASAAVCCLDSINALVNPDPRLLRAEYDRAHAATLYRLASWLRPVWEQEQGDRLTQRCLATFDHVSRQPWHAGGVHAVSATGWALQLAKEIVTLASDRGRVNLRCWAEQRTEIDQEGVGVLAGVLAAVRHNLATRQLPSLDAMKAEIGWEYRRAVRDFEQQAGFLQPPFILPIDGPALPQSAVIEALRAARNPTELLSICGTLRHDLAPANELRNVNTARAPAWGRELWAAMRRMGDEVPQAPEFLQWDEDELLFSFLRDEQTRLHPETALAAVDAATAWCVQHGANSDADQGEARPPVEAGDAAEQDRVGQAGALSPFQYDILDALRSLKATDPEKRATGPDIAERVGGTATAQSVKGPLADLGEKELVASKTGRKGGTWLTKKGLDCINSLRPKQ